MKKLLKVLAMAMVASFLMIGSVSAAKCNCRMINGLEICFECPEPDGTSVITPEPTTIVLLGVGIIGIIGLKRKIKR